MVPDYDADQPADRTIRFRVGINIGDVIADGTDLHGDGVNVASRLQAECPPGGMCVSRAVHDHVHRRLGLVFDELGPLSLKNISRPVEAFLLRLGPDANRPSLLPSAPIPNPPAGRAKLPRLSVMVAPLRNQGVPKEHEYLVESISEDISTDLSQYPGSVVVDCPEALRRNGGSGSPRDIARDLGAVYVIQGSIRGIVDRISVNLQLVDVETGVRLWSERFDNDLGSRPDAGNEIAHRMAFTLGLKLTEEVNRRIEALPPEDWSFEQLVIRGWTLLSRPWTAEISQDSNRQEALRCFEQALARAPDSIPARLGVASVLITNMEVGHSSTGGPDEARSEQLLADVLRVNGQIAITHTLIGILRRMQGRLNDSLVALKIAIGLAPNVPWTNLNLGVTLVLLGQPEAAISPIETSLRLSPYEFYTPISYVFLGLCRLLLGYTEEAIALLRTARAMNPRLFYVHLWLAAALGLKGELDEAGAALRQALEMRPGLVWGLAVWLRQVSPSFVALFEKTAYVGLRRAGLPDLWAGTNERPVGWIGTSDTDASL